MALLLPLPFPPQFLSSSHPKFFSKSRFPSKSLILSGPRNQHVFVISSAVSKSGNLPTSTSIYDSIKHKSVIFLHILTYAILLAVSGARACDFAPNETTVDVSSKEELEDGELKAEFEKWKSKTYSLTVPLRIVALQGSFPPNWIKDFIQVQGRRCKLSIENRTTLDSIYSELSSASDKGQVNPKSAMSADIISIGDSWINYAIKNSLIQPIKDAKEQDWFKILSEKWKVYLCRNNTGELDPNGDIWAAPYRWGTMVIAYKKSKFKNHNLKPIEDWEDLWRPELAGKISMIDSPREIIGATIKYLKASYNTKDIESQVQGGKDKVLQCLTRLQSQVRVFDSVHYLKSFSNGDVWVTVGWSGDVINTAKRMSDVAVIVPNSGSSLWADFWAIPNTSEFSTNKVGGRIRGPSPLTNQWINFCLQTSRDLLFREMVVPGASPLVLEPSVVDPQEKNNGQNDGKPKLETNLIDGMPPREVMEKCEFLEPLSEKAFEDYVWLVSRMNKSGFGLIGTLKDRVFSRFKADLNS